MTKNSSKKLLDNIVAEIEELKGDDITVLDLSNIENAVSTYFVVCSGNSNTHVASIAGAVERKIKTQNHERPISIEGRDNALWVLMDYASVVVHIFQKQAREYYDIESMWGDAKVVNV